MDPDERPANRSGRPNRLAPNGSLHAVAARGSVWGNRGALLDEHGRLARHARGRGWVCCLLDFRGRHRDQWRLGYSTELYALDEATALAAGHRPCGECRHAAYADFRRRWQQVFPADVDAAAIDRRLHAARLAGPGEHRRFEAPLADLPDGTVVVHDDQPWLVLGAELRPWSFAGYGQARARADLPATVSVQTPEPTVAVLAAGYAPLLHASASLRR